MPHRDPETGKFVSDGQSAEPLEYADFEVQEFLANLQGGTNDDNRFVFDPVEGRLNSDEVAELAIFTRTARVGPGSNTIDGDFIQGEAELGINYGDIGFATGVDANWDETGEGEGDAFTDVGSRTNNALLDYFEGSLLAPGGGPSETIWVDLIGTFGTGIAVDQSDNLNLRMNQNAPNNGQMTYTGRLYWLIHEIEDRVPQFGFHKR